MQQKDLQQISWSIISVLSKLEEKQEVFNFLSDLLTQQEIIEFSRRFQVAQMLDNNVKYSEIETKTGMSSTTIARISRFLQWTNNGYRKAISLLKSVSDKHHTGHCS